MPTQDARRRPPPVLGPLVEWLDRTQVETGLGEALDPGRARAMLTTGPAATEAETALLLASPLARAVLAEALLDLREAFGRRTARFAAAAASGVPLRIALEGEGWRIAAVPPALDGEPWLIDLVLSDALLDALPAGSAVRVADEGGLVWIEGEPDEDGRVLAAWPHAASPSAVRPLTLALSDGPT